MTGVQTCALPILKEKRRHAGAHSKLGQSLDYGDTFPEAKRLRMSFSTLPRSSIAVNTATVRTNVAVAWRKRYRCKVPIRPISLETGRWIGAGQQKPATSKRQKETARSMGEKTGRITNTKAPKQLELNLIRMKGYHALHWYHG